MLSDYFYKTHAAERGPVFVIDVGCSYYGVGNEWNCFGAALCGVGFDPLEAEIKRLKETEKRPNISYEAAFVGLSQARKSEGASAEILSAKASFNPNPFFRSSAYGASQAARFDHIKEFFNSGADAVYTSRRISIDEWVAETGKIPQVLKVDVDGPDFEVLLGADRTIESSLLALHVECHIQGASIGRYTNRLSAIETFLREKGFFIFTMEPARYSRSALPGPFCYNMFAQTETGQMVWADVLFIRDLTAPDYETTFGFEATRERIVATACIMERFGLQDCAADLLTHFAGKFAGGVDEALNTLVPDYLGPGLSYRQYIARFEENPKALFHAMRAQAPREPLVAKSFESIDPRNGLADPTWGSTVQHTSSQGVELQTSAQLWAYTYIVRMPEREGRGLVEMDIRVTNGRIGVAVLGETIADLSSVVWLDADTNTQAIVLPVADLGKSVGIVVRNGTEDGSASSATIEKARLLKP